MPSSKLREAAADTESECALDMSPMIDMVFLLLIFFIVNATAIIVKTDPAIKPPIAKNSKDQKDGQGRIVVNVRADGVFTAEDFNVILADDKDIENMVKNAAERHKALGVTPKLHVRGDKDALFKYSRKAINAAARAGVSEVVFSVFVRAK
jgi:biopolymer transport protein ExbD